MNLCFQHFWPIVHPLDSRLFFHSRKRYSEYGILDSPSWMWLSRNLYSAVQILSERLVAICIRESAKFEDNVRCRKVDENLLTIIVTVLVLWGKLNTGYTHFYIPHRQYSRVAFSQFRQSVGDEIYSRFALRFQWHKIIVSLEDVPKWNNLLFSWNRSHTIGTRAVLKRQIAPLLSPLKICFNKHSYPAIITNNPFPPVSIPAVSSLLPHRLFLFQPNIKSDYICFTLLPLLPFVLRLGGFPAGVIFSHIHSIFRRQNSHRFVLEDNQFAGVVVHLVEREGKQQYHRHYHQH